MDDLLFNLLNNVGQNIDIISSKEKLIDYSNKYHCEKQLGIKSSYQFGCFQYMRTVYDKEDFEKL